MSDKASPRVNGARLLAYKGKNIRLPCKVLKFSGDEIVVESSDGQTVSVDVGTADTSELTDTAYIEVIGKAVHESRVRMITYIPQGNDLDLQLVNHVVELTHQPRFADIFF